MYITLFIYILNKKNARRKENLSLSLSHSLSHSLTLSLSLSLSPSRGVYVPVCVHTLSRERFLCNISVQTIPPTKRVVCVEESRNVIGGEGEGLRRYNGSNEICFKIISFFNKTLTLFLTTRYRPCLFCQVVFPKTSKRRMRKEDTHVWKYKNKNKKIINK